MPGDRAGHELPAAGDRRRARSGGTGELGPGWRPTKTAGSTSAATRRGRRRSPTWAAMVGKGWPPPAHVRRGRAHGDGRSRRRSSWCRRSIPLTASACARISLDAARRRCCRSTPRSRRSQGPPVRVAVWTITQLAPPYRMFALPAGAVGVCGRASPAAAGGAQDLTVAGGRLSAGARPDGEDDDRDRRRCAGVGRRRSDHVDLIIETDRRAAGGRAPSGRTARTAQIYTNPDGPDAYVELELLGPLPIWRPGRAPALDRPLPAASPQDADALEEAQRVFDGSRRPEALSYGQVGNCAVVSPKGDGFCRRRS